MSERVKAPRVAEITGLSLRSVQKLAPRIPSAARFGKIWTFREDAVRQWVLGKEEETWQTTSTGGARPGGVEFRLPARNSDEAYEQILRPKRASVSRTGRTG